MKRSVLGKIPLPVSQRSRLCWAARARYAGAGRRTEDLRFSAGAPAPSRGYVPAAAFAQCLLGLGDTEEALYGLERAAEELSNILAVPQNTSVLRCATRRPAVCVFLRRRTSYPSNQRQHPPRLHIECLCNTLVSVRLAGCPVAGRVARSASSPTPFGTRSVIRKNPNHFNIIRQQTVLICYTSLSRSQAFPRNVLPRPAVMRVPYAVPLTPPQSFPSLSTYFLANSRPRNPFAVNGSKNPGSQINAC